MKFSFIHTADIHLGRAFADIDYELSAAQKEILGKAHEKAFTELCEFATEKNVDFVLVAGDTFDDCEHDLHSRLVLFNNLKRLENCKTAVYIVPGNHDPASSYTKELGFENSEYIKIFGVNLPSEPLGIKNKIGEDIAIIYPFGFKTKEYSASPCKVLEKSKSSTLFNIGLIHCDKSGDMKNVYAPCTEKELLELNYDYYALGHIHKPDTGGKIVYPGTIQSRSRKDTGEHGFCYVTVDNNRIVSNEFIKCDKVRYYDLTVSVTENETELDMVTKLQSELSGLSSGIELVIINLTLEGICRYKKTSAEVLKQELSTEKIVVSNLTDNSVYDVDVDLIKSSGGMLTQILAAAENDLTVISEETDKELAELFKFTDGVDKSLLENKAVLIAENICKEIYGGEND